MLELCSSIRLGSKSGKIHTHTHAHTCTSIKNRLGKTVSVQAKQMHTCMHRHTHDTTDTTQHDTTRHDMTRHDITMAPTKELDLYINTLYFPRVWEGVVKTRKE